MTKPRWVRIPAGKPLHMEHFPDFLLIGPQRTGTTWLFDQLRRHPEILMPARKETYFFSKLKRVGRERALGGDLTRYLELFEDSKLRKFQRTIECRRSFGEAYRPRIRGEATATYAAMSPELIDEIVALRPDIKAVLMVRDPVERAWSHAKKDLALGRDRGRPSLMERLRQRQREVSDAEYEKFFRDPYQRRCGQYRQLIDTWQERLRSGHLLVRAFDEITTDPETLLMEVFSFIGVDRSERYLPPGIRERVNATGGDLVPERLRASLEQLFGEEPTRQAELSALVRR